MQDKVDNMDVVFATWVAAFRNIKGFPFPNKMNSEEKESLLGIAEELADELNLNMRRLGDMDSKSRSNYLLTGSEICAANNRKSDDLFNDVEGKATMDTEDDRISVLVNEMDHFEIVGKSFDSNVNVRDLYNRVDEIATAIEKKMDVAFSEKLGFLTSRPRKVGTGIYISFTVAIPGIVKSGMFAKFEKRLMSLDWNIVPYRMSQVPKTESIYRISNLATLGVSEDKLLMQALQIVDDITKLELMCREAIYKKNKMVVEDHYYRAYGLLRYCRRIESAEACEAICWLRLANDLIENNEIELDSKVINELLTYLAMPNVVFLKHSRSKIDELRAKRIKRILEGGDDQ